MYKYEEEKMDIEEEVLYENASDGEIKNPFNPKDVDIITQPMVISNVVERLKRNAIELTPDFQRLPGLWDDVKQSRLIESLIIRIPLPSFYFDYVDDDEEDEKLVVVDGQQRLYAIKRFMALETNDPNRLKLKGLEYLSEYDGFIFEDLPVPIQRRIREQPITSYMIRSGTPESVRTSIFKRINTGGMTLTMAEIRNSVYRGQAAELLRELAKTESFIKATRGKIDNQRMLDCEFVNRTLAFYLLGVNQYDGNFDDYIDKSLIAMKKASKKDIKKYKEAFLRSMDCCNKLFGEYSFRKLQSNGKFGKINKPLYECVSVSFAYLSKEQCRHLLIHKNEFIDLYMDLLKDNTFSRKLSGGTGKIESVKERHSRIRKIIERTLGDDSIFSN